MFFLFRYKGRIGHFGMWGVGPNNFFYPLPVRVSGLNNGYIYVFVGAAFSAILEPFVMMSIQSSSLLVVPDAVR